jgi:NADH:ubiquinone oxidoreductase subunit 6 (subunit J)
VKSESSKERSARQWAGKCESEGQNTDQLPEMVMKRYWMFVAIAFVLLLAALGFALDVGIVAMTLRSEAD